MTLKECYTALGGDYAQVIQRLKKETIVIHFIKLFIQEDLYEKLTNALAADDVHTAFRAAHSLKGNCMSLEFTPLQKAADTITELLRKGYGEKVSELLVPLAREYERTVRILQQLDE